MLQYPQEACLLLVLLFLLRLWQGDRMHLAVRVTLSEDYRKICPMAELRVFSLARKQQLRSR